MNESEWTPALLQDNTVDNLSLMCLSPLQALPYVALLIVMLFFIYAVIGMQVSSCLVPLFPFLCLLFFSLHLSSYRAFCPASDLLESDRVAVRSHRPSLLHFSSPSSCCSIVNVCPCLFTFSLFFVLLSCLQAVV